MNIYSLQDELVSVIIPTYRRPKEVRLAALSALNQTHHNVEVLVVSDGPDADTREAIESLATADPRLRYFELPTNRGPAEARNVGVWESHGNWLCFLDDDDTMLPDKVRAELTLADPADPRQMISCRTIYRHDGRDDLWPTRPIAPDEDVADYILRRPSLLGRPGVLPIQTLLMHRSILADVPFTTHRDHEDWAWLLEAVHRGGATVAFVWEPLVIYNIVTDGLSRSRRTNWRDSLAWLERYREWISPAAHNSFLATKVAIKARRAGEWSGLWKIARAVLRNRPSWLDLMFLCGTALLPSWVLQSAWKRSLRNTAEAPGRNGEPAGGSGDAAGRAAV